MLLDHFVLGVGQRHAPAECNLREIFIFSLHSWRDIFGEVFRFGHPNPGKHSTRKISPKVRAKFHDTFAEKNGEKFTPHFCRAAALKSVASSHRVPHRECPTGCLRSLTPCGSLRLVSHPAICDPISCDTPYIARCP